MIRTTSQCHRPIAAMTRRPISQAVQHTRMFTSTLPSPSIVAPNSVHNVLNHPLHSVRISHPKLHATILQRLLHSSNITCVAVSNTSTSTNTATLTPSPPPPTVQPSKPTQPASPRPVIGSTTKAETPKANNSTPPSSAPLSTTLKPSTSSASSTPTPPSSSATSTTKTPSSSTGFSFVAWYDYLRPRIRSYIYIGLAIATMYFIFRVGYSTVDFFATLSFLDVGEVAFFSGMLASLILVGIAYAIRRHIVINPESVYKEVVRRVTSEATVKSMIGDNITTGQFKAFAFVPGSLRSQPLTITHPSATNTWSARILQYYRPRRLQLFFKVNGSHGSAMVSTEVEKFGGIHRYNTLCIDLVDTNERLILEGPPEYRIYQGIIKLR